MHLVHLAEPSILLALDDEMNIMRIWRVRRTYQPDACVLRLRGIVPEPSGRSAIIGEHYHADGRACWRLINWTIDRLPGASAMAHHKAYERLFVENPDVPLRAVLRIYGGTDDRAPGQESYFCAQQHRNHPNAMAALALLGSMKLPQAADW